MGLATVLFTGINAASMTTRCGAIHTHSLFSNSRELPVVEGGARNGLDHFNVAVTVTSPKRAKLFRE